MMDAISTHVEILVIAHGDERGDDHDAIADFMLLLEDESGIRMIEPQLIGVPGPPTFSQTSRIVLAVMSAGLLKRLGAILRSWLGVDTSRVIKLTIDGSTIELRQGSEAQYDRLVDAFIARLADKPRIESSPSHHVTVDDPHKRPSQKHRLRD